MRLNSLNKSRNPVYDIGIDMLFDKEKFKNYLNSWPSFTSTKPATCENTINNLLKIAEVLFSLLKLPHQDQLMNCFDVLFYPANKAEIMKFKNGETYTARFLEALMIPRNQKLIQSLAEPYDLNTHDYVTVIQTTRTLLELHIIGVEIEDDYLQDLLAISQLLLSQDSFAKYMLHLEMALQLHAKNMNATLTAHHSDLFTLPPPAKDKPYHRQKILSSFFYAWARQNHFNQDHYAHLNEILEMKNFLGLLANKIIFKDNGAPKDHSAWAHLIQLYWVTEANKEKPFLKHDPAELYAMLGNIQYTAKKRELIAYDTHETAWDIFFDRPLKFPSKFDFRKPENISHAIFEDASHHQNAKWPLLSSSIERQYNKPHSESKSFHQKKEPVQLIQYKR